MYKGYLNLVLHAHLPYIRHPEHEFFLEENWFYEAVIESYIPLIDVFNSLLDDRVNFNVTLSFSPSLVEMFNDPLLRERCLRHINNLIELSEKEILRTKGDSSFEPLARMYNERFRRIRFLYEDIYKKDLTSAFRKLAETGNIEIITTAATHAYLPAFSSHLSSVRAQIKVAADTHAKNFGKRPNGIWLPECGYFTGLDKLLKETRIKVTFLEAHGVLNGTPVPRYGLYSPVSCPSGVIVFPRDIDSSRQVWSSIEGYPGDFDYRDFYRDIGFDLPADYIKPQINHDNIKTYTGIKYHSITGPNSEKNPYIREKALLKAEEHAEDFVKNRKLSVECLNSTMKFNPVITAPYDTELFGHWWFEGPEWLNFLFRKIDKTKEKDLTTITSSQYLELKKNKLQRVNPSASSWGHRGYHDVWINDSNKWIYRPLHEIADKMTELADSFPKAVGIKKRALKQAAREILLSQHSDWPFILKTGVAAEYATKRINGHIEKFKDIYSRMKSDSVTAEWLEKIEKKDMIFSEIDYRVYSTQFNSLSKG
ncbi:MAG: DUF1957 domain-containing protein [Nitrospiraceae bacterium]|nr:DUF1957 domain-containing protein [Nitrospiraceae bacterium]